MNAIKKIQHNCKHATFLIEKKQLTILTPIEKIKLRIHLIGCSVCRIFQRQSVIINSMVKQMFDNNADTNLKLSDGYKKELQTQIENKLK